MRASLEYMRRYRATVAIEPAAKTVITDQMIAAELARWQLYGQVTETVDGYQLDAQFRGRSGTYTLPDEVKTVEMIG
jgi:hypothetical protein